MKNRITDLSSRTGVFQGDLKYGRCNGNTSEKHKDFVGEGNAPIVPLVLVQPRDQSLWTKDNRVKKLKSLPHSNQMAINYLIESYVNCNSNINLTVGKQRM